ncbi:MAG: putative toxin-antitoxin system toxin component, PIN family [bacterium]|nr:putative toxin-antitoxin system toxin component, PIN family [bacterium]
MPSFTIPSAVLDTNLVVRLLITGHGASGRLLTSLVLRQYRLVTSEPLLDELVTTLRYPRLQRYGPFSEQDLTRILGTLRRVALVVPGRYTDLDKVPTDAKDNIVVACALEAGADYIVTDDRRDLLPLKVIHCPGYRPVQIVSPTAFLQLLGR